MKSVVLALGAVVVLGCAGQPSGRPVLEPAQDTVFDELAAVVDQALAAKSVEEDRLVRYGVEKQRLVARLMPNGDLADGHPLAIEGYVPKGSECGAGPGVHGSRGGPVRNVFLSVGRTIRPEPEAAPRLQLHHCLCGSPEFM